MAKKKSPTGQVSVAGAVTTVVREVRKHKTVAESAPPGQGAHIPPAPKRSPEELARDIQRNRDELARTVRELETALDVPARAADLREDAVGRVRAVRDDVSGRAKAAADEVSVRAQAVGRRVKAFTRKDPAVAASIGAGAVAVVLAVGAAVVTGGRR